MQGLINKKAPAIWQLPEPFKKQLPLPFIPAKKHKIMENDRLLSPFAVCCISKYIRHLNKLKALITINIVNRGFNSCIN